MAEKVILKVVADTGKASKNMNALSSDTKGATAQTTLLGGAMNMVRGAMLKVKAMSKLLFGSIKAGLISTGIGAFVVIIGSLISYFTNTKKGAEMLERALAGFGAAISVITDRVSALGGIIVDAFNNPKQAIADLWSAIKTNIINRFTGLVDIFTSTGKILKAVFTLDFDALKDGLAEYAESIVQVATGVDDLTGKMAKGFSSVTEEISKEVAAAMRLKEELQGIADATREFNIEKAQTNQEIAKALLLAEDETKTNEVRLQALKDALTLEEKTTAKQLELQRRRVAAIEEEVGLGESMAEDLDRLNAEKIRLIELETASIKQKKKVVTQVNAFELDIANQEKARQKVKTDAAAKETAIKQKEADKQKAIDEKILADKEALLLSEGEKLLLIQQENALLLIEDANERALAQIEIDRENALNDVADTEHSESMKAAINEKYNKKKQDQNKATSDGERKLRLGDLGSLASVLGDMASMQQEGTDGWKKTKVAEARINSFMSASSAFSAMAGIPIVGPALGAIAAGAALVSGQKQVDSINATEIPKMARGGVVGGYGTGTSDSVNAKLSKGEVVINAKSAKMFRGALSGMNVAGGGVGFARGGATTPSSGAGFTGLSNEPLKAFVITDDLSDSQAKLAKIRRRSKL
tara:strand:- start:5193 stop:7121 length:1929 start_codon:yes stop_codon:yes gene_type:complete